MAQYKVYGTNDTYNGEVVEIGGSLYTTKGGALEGDSLQVIADASSVRDVVNNVNNREATSALANAMIENGGLTTPTNNLTDVVTAFVVGDGSLFGGGTYFYNLAGTNRVPRGAKLHHHTIPPDNRNSFMSQHTMDGNETDVYSIQQVNARRAGRGPAVGGTRRSNGSINIGVSPGITPPDVTPPPGDGGGGPKFGQQQDMENQGGSGY
tara:strand:- start:11 stop:637 length:627 start_codon:yes stop_codon:yes gene_type:complete